MSAVGIPLLLDPRPSALPVNRPCDTRLGRAPPAISTPFAPPRPLAPEFCLPGPRPLPAPNVCPPPTRPTSAGDADRSVTNFFGTALSLAFVVAPCVGAAIDVVGFGLVMAIITLALILTNSLLLFTPLAIAYPASLIYAAGRVSLWATFFSYCGAVFGFVHYGERV